MSSLIDGQNSYGHRPFFLRFLILSSFLSLPLYKSTDGVEKGDAGVYTELDTRASGRGNGEVSREGSLTCREIRTEQSEGHQRTDCSGGDSRTVLVARRIAQEKASKKQRKLKSTNSVSHIEHSHSTTREYSCMERYLPQQAGSWQTGLICNRAMCGGQEGKESISGSCPTSNLLRNICSCFTTLPCLA